MSISNLIFSKELNIKTNSLETNSLVNKNGEAMISFPDASSDVINFNNKTVVGMNVSHIGDAFEHVVIDDSLQIGAGADGTKPKLYNTADSNLVIDGPPSTQINMSINGIAQTFVNSSGLNIPSGSLFISSQGANITQSNGDMWYRVNSSKSHRFKVNGVDEVIIDSSGISLPSGNNIKINDAAVINETSLGNSIISSSLTSLGVLGTAAIKNNHQGLNVVLPTGRTLRDTELNIKMNDNAGATNNIMFDTNNGGVSHNILFGKYGQSNDSTHLNIKHVLNESTTNDCLTVYPDSTTSHNKLVCSGSDNSDYNGGGALSLSDGGLSVFKNTHIGGSLNVGGNAVNYKIDCSSGACIQSINSAKSHIFKIGTTQVMDLNETNTNIYTPVVIHNNDINLRNLIASNDIKINTPGGLLEFTGALGNSGFITNSNSTNLLYEANNITHKFRVNSADKLTISSTELRSNNSLTTLGYGLASQLSIIQDSSNCYFNIPTGKSHKFQVNTSDILSINSSQVNSQIMIIGVGGSNPTNVSANCGIRSGNGILASNGDFYGSSHIKVEMGLGQNYGFITSTSSSNPLMTLSCGTTSNTITTFQMKPNYTGTILNGFRSVASYGEDSNNRYNSEYRIDQYVNAIDGGAAINAWETRMSLGSRRHVRFSTTGSGTNDIYLFNGEAYKPSGGVWAVSSDVRLKENIEDVKTKEALSVINSIKLHYFDYVDEFNKKYNLPTHKKIGVIAQELEEIPLLKPCVINGEDEVFYNGTETYTEENGEEKTRPKEVKRISNRKQVNMDRVYHFLIGSVQELNKQNAYLLTKLKEKDTQITEIGNRLNALERNVQNTTNIDTFDDSVSYTKGIADNVSFIG